MAARPTAELVFTCDFDDRTAYEAEQKGWFDAAIARLPNGIEVPLAFRDPIRLVQDFQTEQSLGKCCLAMPGLVVVSSVTRANMVAAVAELSEEGYFDGLVSAGFASRRLPDG